MPDLPDWYQGFQLVGSDITINVNIEASGVTLPISIDAVTVTLDVNLTGQDVTIDFNFADQSVAVFDAAKWFAHNAEQIFVFGTASLGADGQADLVTRTVPTGKTFYVAGYAWGQSGAAAITATAGQLQIGTTGNVHKTGEKGGSIIFDVPLRATTGQVVRLNITNVSAATSGYAGGFWGWDEED